jgi:hypothetical protein
VKPLRIGVAGLGRAFTDAGYGRDLPLPAVVIEPPKNMTG